MNIETISKEKIQKLIDYRNRMQEATRMWKLKHPDYNKYYSKEYNETYFGAMKDQTVFCDCCQVEVKKISYPSHKKGKKHLAKSAGVDTENTSGVKCLGC